VTYLDSKTKMNFRVCFDVRCGFVFARVSSRIDLLALTTGVATDVNAGVFVLCNAVTLSAYLLFNNKTYNIITQATSFDFF
jgi:hypothetical protein